jgi:hypothetical protein
MRKIDMTETRFQKDDISSQFVGAGIVPITKKGGIWSLILGKERYDPSWPGSHKWSAFEGGKKEGERMEETAAREFLEESMGCVSLLREGREIPLDEESILSLLDAKKYILKTVLSIQMKSRAHKQFYVMYLVESSSGDECPPLFEEKRLSFLESAAGEENGNDYLEKEKISVWPLPKLKCALSNGGSYNNELFRVCFLASLQVILEKTECLLPNYSS